MGWVGYYRTRALISRVLYYENEIFCRNFEISNIDKIKSENFSEKIIKSQFFGMTIETIYINRLHQDLATAGKRAVRPPAVARSGGSEAIFGTFFPKKERFCDKIYLSKFRKNSKN